MPLDDNGFEPFCAGATSDLHARRPCANGSSSQLVRRYDDKKAAYSHRLEIVDRSTGNPPHHWDCNISYLGRRFRTLPFSPERTFLVTMYYFFSLRSLRAEWIGVLRVVECPGGQGSTTEQRPMIRRRWCRGNAFHLALTTWLTGFARSLYKACC